MSIYTKVRGKLSNYTHRGLLYMSDPITSKEAVLQDIALPVALTATGYAGTEMMDGGMTGNQFMNTYGYGILAGIPAALTTREVANRYARGFAKEFNPGFVKRFGFNGGTDVDWSSSQNMGGNFFDFNRFKSIVPRQNQEYRNFTKNYLNSAFHMDNNEFYRLADIRYGKT